MSSSEPSSGIEGHHGLSTHLKEEQDIAHGTQETHPHSVSNHNASTSSDLASSPSSSGAKMEGYVESNRSLTSSPKKRSYNTTVYQEDDGALKYDPSNEPPPNAPIFHDSYIIAKDLALQIPSEILEIIEGSGCSGEGVEYIRDHARKAKKLEFPSSVLVGLTGDSGTGKSSVISSLLGKDGIAPSGDEGEACTAVVQEFRQHRESQKSPYESEIVFFNEATRNKALWSWVTDFWNYEQAKAARSDDEFLDDDDGASTAVTALFSLFCDHAECENIDKTQEFLQTATDLGVPAIVSKLQSWTESLLNRHGAKQNEITIRYHEPSGVQAEIARYMRQTKTNGKWEPSPWPFVQIIRTFLHAPLLAHGVVLADLPGSSDTNQTRRQAAMEYSRTLEFTIVVSNISRAQTDTATQRYLTEAFKRRRGPSACMVATRSDSIRPTKGYLNTCVGAAGPDDANNLTMLRDQREDTNSRLSQIKAEVMQARRRKDRDTEELLSEEREGLELKKVDQDAKILEKCIEMRNHKVAEAVNKKYSPLMRGADRLPVFCVSNQTYIAHIQGYERTQPPRTNVKATGIPELQDSLICLPARRKFEAFKEHLRIKLPSLLNSINIAFSEGWIQEKADLEKIILAAQDSISVDIESIFTRLLEENLLVIFEKMETNKSEYVKSARSELEKFSSWHHSSYKAFTNRRGNFETKSAGKHDWNRAMLAGLVKDIEKDTLNWDHSSIKLAEDLSRDAGKRVDQLVEKLEAAAKFRRAVLRPFFDELHLQKDHLKAKCKDVALDFERELILLKERILTTDHIDESYFVLGMHKAYDECATTIGIGSHNKRCDILMEQVSNVAKGPFHNVHAKAKSEARRLTRKHAERLSHQLLSIFKDIHKTFMLGFKTEERDPPDLKELRTKLRSKVPALKDKLNEIERHLEICEFESQ